MKRRNFIKNASLTGVGITVGASAIACNEQEKTPSKKAATIDTSKFPIAICTWGFAEANAKAGEALSKNISALDAAIKGVAVEEQNIKNTTVGKGGAPDRDGNVTLDACVMNSDGDCGAVLCVENITNVAALAKKVMEDTPHVMLAGKGAEEFAYTQGFKKEELLTEASKKAWEKWKETSKYQPIINIENHDTIGMLTMDKNGNIAGACTTSGLAYKMKGRIGDSPIIGSGLFIDNEIGGAVATGMGEEVVKTVGSFLIVELMRQGKSPQEACEEAISRIVSKGDRYKDFQIAYLAMNKAGDIGSYCIHKGFTYMKYQSDQNKNISSDYFNKE
ncbi:N(4)-(beta-N-acetylglucosaminyl)-L-asparaginase [Flavobacteriaceae bacterium S0825]|uniref:isoaspartyl peptidase/L-asparaginase family protein n=1 Tax=Gaetbulibacter sp. S0825 TaxID=2720084 RepID=UPI00143053F4|nr:N(4)-(beta-N-acetylglucosaminyl)-L-asparaginase [Gaetbulibacter sp. S0825]MCK0108465.1 N(4)-(beta-N-acetylglucosaminyl)-L-asparaginase [Flavobacteriaceae bacterium S0825]NIX64101.1 N(4)-(beta-N-acetylglucosaminyl)-L-asparaginase [Gaetbulibacter sp. S0825]